MVEKKHSGNFKVEVDSFPARWVKVDNVRPLCVKILLLNAMYDHEQTRSFFKKNKSQRVNAPNTVGTVLSVHHN